MLTLDFFEDLKYTRRVDSIILSLYLTFTTELSEQRMI